MKKTKKFVQRKLKKNTFKINTKYIILILLSIIIVFIIFSTIFEKHKKRKNNNCNKYCYKPFTNSNIKIIHVIITRFLIGPFVPSINFGKIMKTEAFIQNAKTVLNKYLLSALEKQRCTDFIWVLMIGDNTNLTYFKSFFNFQNSFKTEIIYEKDIKNYLRSVAHGSDVLITTRIDYDDIIYYDAVNDVRKLIDMKKPLIVHGYRKGYLHFESDNNIYYNFNDQFGNDGIMSIFISLITLLNKVNDIYSIYDLGDHTRIKSTFLNKYKSFGIDNINYNPFEFDNSAERFIWIRQKFSFTFINRDRIKNLFKLVDFNESNIYDKCI